MSVPIVAREACAMGYSDVLGSTKALSDALRQLDAALKPLLEEVLK